MKRVLYLFSIITILITTTVAQPQETQKYADLGDFPLENRQVICECRIGYRTFGTLNPEKSNAVLIPTWFSGTTKALEEYIGSGKMFDSTNFFIIAVDAFGNGVSSSPSNSTVQSGSEFPEFSIRDMVNAQYKLLTQELHLTKLYAVMGISMGGM